MSISLASPPGRLTAQVLQQLSLDSAQLVDHLDHVHRNPDGARLVGHGPGDRLPDPPGRVGRELVTLGVVELFDRTDQAEVALLDQVQERHAAAGVALRQRHHQPQVRLEQVVLGPVAVAADPRHVAALRGSFSPTLGDLAQLRGVEAGLDPLRQFDFLLGVEQRDLADLLEVRAHGVGRAVSSASLRAWRSASDSSSSHTKSPSLSFSVGSAISSSSATARPRPPRRTLLRPHDLLPRPQPPPRGPTSMSTTVSTSTSSPRRHPRRLPRRRRVPRRRRRDLRVRGCRRRGLRRSTRPPQVRAWRSSPAISLLTAFAGAFAGAFADAWPAPWPPTCRSLGGGLGGGLLRRRARPVPFGRPSSPLPPPQT